MLKILLAVLTVIPIVVKAIQKLYDPTSTKGNFRKFANSIHGELPCPFSILVGGGNSDNIEGEYRHKGFGCLLKKHMINTKLPTKYNITSLDNIFMPKRCTMKECNKCFLSNDYYLQNITKT